MPCSRSFSHPCLRASAAFALALAAAPVRADWLPLAQSPGLFPGPGSWTVQIYELASEGNLEFGLYRVKDQEIRKTPGRPAPLAKVLPLGSTAVDLPRGLWRLCVRSREGRSADLLRDATFRVCIRDKPETLCVDQEVEFDGKTRRASLSHTVESFDEKSEGGAKIVENTILVSKCLKPVSRRSSMDVSGSAAEPGPSPEREDVQPMDGLAASVDEIQYPAPPVNHEDRQLPDSVFHSEGEPVLSPSNYITF